MPLELPKAFTAQMQTLLGGEFADFMHALEEKPPVSLRMNTRKPGAIFPDEPDVDAIPWANNGLYLPVRPKFFKDPLQYAGGYYVQEASSMLIGQMADFSEDMKVLDLCAAPGGKSTLLASRLSKESLLVANELVGNRARVLLENVSRWGDPKVLVANNHPRDYPALGPYFDLIFVDAPCSGEGMFRKDPKVIGTWKPGIVRACVERQKAILSEVIHALKPGGRLIYSTCTYNRKENEDIVQWLLGMDRGMMEIAKHEFPEEWGLVPGSTDGYDPDMRFTYHCYPHKVRGEGFFVACLEKTRASRFGPPKGGKRKQRMAKKSNKRRHEKGDRHRGTSTPISKADLTYAKRFLAEPAAFDLQAYEGQIHALPEHQSADFRHLSEKLRFLRSGITMGIPAKGRLHPDHDLAMSEATGTEVPVIPVDFEQAMRYLKRDEMQIDAGDARGWAILSHKDRHLGWVKVLEKRVNNHLPRYLRIRADLRDLY
ncbi:MAG: RsmF rRNA methyltransferase first C-terminal domain-containing protein [Bacteroidota bacterium]